MVLILSVLAMGALLIGALVYGTAPARERAATLQAEKVKSLSVISGFSPTIVHEGVPGAYGLAIDPASEQLAIAIPGHPARLYHFSQLVAAEVVKDGETVTTTRGKVDTAGAAIATALIGPLGMALGAKTSSTSRSTNEVSKLALKLFVNDLYSPCFEVPFLSVGVGSDSSSPWVVKAAKELDDWYGRFRTIIAGFDRQSASYDPEKAIRHMAPAPHPVN
jgi:hypothetical protein